MNSRTVDSFMGLLSERVNYHTWGSASKDRIRVDREAFKTRWPRATYALNSAPEIIELSETTVIANFAVTYDAWNFRKCTGSRGTSRFTLRINEIGGRWRIAGIQEQTPDRSSYDPCNRPGDDRG